MTTKYSNAIRKRRGVPPRRFKTQTVPIEFSDSVAESVAIAGRFNDWQATATPMADAMAFSISANRPKHRDSNRTLAYHDLLISITRLERVGHSKGAFRLQVHLAVPWEQNLKLISDTHYSRYPVLTPEADKPVGVLHVKNIPFAEPAERLTPDRLKALARPLLEMPEDLPLEEALALFQRHYRKMAIVTDAAGQWTGIISNEDVLEEIVGLIDSDYVTERLRKATTPEEIIEAIRAGQQVVLD